MKDIVQEIVNAANLTSKWEPDHPQYVEGALYLTHAQWDAVRDQFPPNAEREGRAHVAWGIPIHLVKPDTIVDLPSGRVLIYSTALDSFYIFDRRIAEDAGLCSGLPRLT